MEIICEANKIKSGKWYLMKSLKAKQKSSTPSWWVRDTARRWWQYQPSPGLDRTRADGAASRQIRRRATQSAPTAVEWAKSDDLKNFLKNMVKKGPKCGDRNLRRKFIDTSFHKLRVTVERGKNLRKCLIKGRLTHNVANNLHAEKSTVREQTDGKLEPKTTLLGCDRWHISANWLIVNDLQTKPVTTTDIN